MRVKTINQVERQGWLPAITHGGAALLTVLVVAGCASGFEPLSSSPGTTFGKIYVDTPEVYSRERLVNDRFQQDAWLREKLDETPTQEIQGSTATSSRTSTNFALGVALPSGKKPKPPENSETAQSFGSEQPPLTPPTPPKPPELPEAQLAKDSAIKGVNDTPIEQFRDAMAYREEVRNEILENQLDDRHDIEGNTLYRLKFDATVVPLHDTSAYAMVEVTLSGPSLWDYTLTQSGVTDWESKEDWETRTGIRLPDWESANYVTGLDRPSQTYLKKAYENWLNTIGSDKYSDEEIASIRSGPLNEYFDVYETGVHESGGREVPGFYIEKKVSCVSYEGLNSLLMARQQLIGSGVSSEYLETRGVSAEGQQLCVLTGWANFISDFRAHNSAVYTYAVTPKERVQRIYGDTLATGAVGASIGVEQGGLGAALAHSNAREARANAIMRQPQVVGYSVNPYQRLGDVTPSGAAAMGWLIGPRYKISSDPNGGVSFRHVPSQHTLTGIISVPSWWTELSVITRTYWLDENGVEFSVEGNDLSTGVVAETFNRAKIALPGNQAGILDVLDPKRRKPRVVEAQPSTAELDQLRACEPGAVIIRGSQLWRSTVVTLGAQQANSISVLPNMKGIIATFKPVQPSMSGKESLYLWTSEGEEYVRDILISGECNNSPAS